MSASLLRLPEVGLGPEKTMLNQQEEDLIIIFHTHDAKASQEAGCEVNRPRKGMI